MTPFGYVNDAAIKGKPAGSEKLGDVLWERSWELDQHAGVYLTRS